MERIANDAQQTAINARNSLITVSAGAGTGKTWTLASRFVSLLTDVNCGCNVENIITLTFTEKAAQEMKERIESAICEKISSAAESESIVLKNALSHFDDAYISTIHSFASGVLKESALVLGLDPTSAIISQPEADELSEELSRKIEELDSTITRCFDDPAVLEKTISEWSPQDIAGLSSECEDMHSARSLTYSEFLQMSGDSVMESVIEKVKVNSMPRIKLAWEAWNNVFCRIKEQIYSDFAAKGKKPDYVLNIREFMEKWDGKVIESNDEFVKYFIELMKSPLQRASFGKYKDDINSLLGEGAKDWKKRHEDLLMISKNLSINEIIANYPEDVNERESLIKLCSICWKLTEEKRRENKILTFTDLIKFSSEAICGVNYRRNFKQIMIDEFQDTDPLQEKMIRSIAKNQPNVSIFVVGDPKQSIYRFRNADLSIFESYVKECQQMQDDGVYIKMNNSFRMRSGLYEKINGLFSYIWPHNLGETISNLKYEDLIGETDKVRDAGTLPIMAILTEKHEKKKAKKELNNQFEDENEDDSAENSSTGDEHEGTSKIDEVRAKLLNELVETLMHWKEGGLTVWDSKEKCQRPFEWRDCAILTQTRTSWTLIEDAFSKAHIPLNIEGNESWFGRGEVMDIVNLLRAVAYPDDELSNMGWHSSFLSPHDKVEEELLRRTAKIDGGAAVLKYFLDNMSWLESIPPSQRMRALANMRYASQLAEEYEKFICRSIHGCSEWLSKSLKSKSRFKEPQINDDGKSVKLLTIHASKGLEFPFVILWGTERLSKSKRTNSSLIASKYLGLFASKHKLFKTFHYALEEQAEAEEYQRLLYVAATRAKDSILFCGISDEQGNAESGSWLKYLLDWNANSNYENITSVHHVNEKITSSLFTETENAFLTNKAVNTLKNTVKLELPEPQISLTRMSATSYALYEWCPYAWRRKYRQGVDIDFENFGGTEKESLSGKDIGSICHWVLSKWDFSVDSIDNYFPREKYAENIVRLLPPHLRASYRINSNREKIRQWLLNFADSEIGEEFRKLYAEGRLKREVPFKVHISDGIKLIGSFDIFWEDETGVHLRDWKTNPNERVLGLYENQLSFYAFALHRLKGNLSTIGLVSIGDCKLMNISNRESFDIIEGRINSAVINAANGQWERRTENCISCPWEGCI